MQEAPVSDRSAPGDPVVRVNGEIRGIPPECSLEQLLVLLEVGNRRVAVAVNREVVARAHYASTRLVSGDRIEILEAVGGG